MIFVVDDLSSFTAKDFDCCISLLSEQRLKYMWKYRFEKDRRLCMLSYMLLRFGLLHEFGISEKPEFQQNANGSDLHMNMSHCCEAVACALDISEVGIDVQNTEVYSNTWGERILTPMENIQIAHAPFPDRRFTEIWSLKEAYGKYMGSGVLYEINNTDLSMIDSGWTRWRDLEMFLYSSQKYALAVCGEKKMMTKRVSVQELKEQLSLVRC